MWGDAGAHVFGTSTGSEKKSRSLAKGVCVRPTEMEDVPNKKISQAIVAADSETGDVRSAITSQAPAIQQVMSVAENFRPSVRGEKIQPARELFFDLRLKTMVVAVAVCSCKAGTLPEIRERDSSLGNGDFRGVCSCRQDSSDVIGAGKDLQMAAQRGYVPGLPRH